MGTLRILMPEILGSQSGYAVMQTEASASFPSSNLLTGEPWQVWRSTNNSPRSCYGVAGITGSPLLSIDGIALAAVNAVGGNGEAMFVLAGVSGGSLSNPGRTELVPTAIAASANITGVVGDVNEGSGATDSAGITPTTSSGAYVIFDFATPGTTPRTGARRQAFWFRVSAGTDTTGENAYKRPSIVVSLYENIAGTPTLVQELGEKAVFGTAKHLLFFSWDASLLADPTGAGVQVRVDFRENSGASVYATIDSAFWESEGTELTADAFYIADSGWIQFLPEPSSGSDVEYSSQLAERYARLSYKFGTTRNANAIYVFIREDHVPSEGSTIFNRFLLQPPPGYVQVGKLAAGLWWSPAINRAQGQFATVDDPSEKFEDDGGGEWGSREDPRDAYTIKLEWLTEQEAAWLNRRLLHEMGTLSPFYLELEPDATFELGFGGWVTLLSESNPIMRRNTDTYTYSMEFTVRVKR